MLSGFRILESNWHETQMLLKNVNSYIKSIK